MAETLRLAVAVIGNVASVSLYAAPIVTFKRVIRKKSTEEFSCIPYTIGLLNCLLFTWYGLPIVSNKWENFPLVTVNGVGIVLELAYVLIYFWYSSSKGKVKVAMIAIPILLVFCAIALASAFAFPDHSHRKQLVGSVGLGGVNSNVCFSFGCYEKSDTNKECGIHATTFIIVFILG
uniref:SWEET sugar transporter n=1 Tax=Medicago truncatula TaxID=3880 RepID=I3SFR6_MEDTR|nr:unknown [Medicago truncatula]